MVANWFSLEQGSADRTRHRGTPLPEGGPLPGFGTLGERLVRGAGVESRTFGYKHR